ncbi:MAG: nucleotidyl transferase AbiEii/AbiGii toxin family protein [Acidobacteria bacterium]|nr:nucleotidyl transferase AbiEii/AbiGii toxin family protein [Acidobacteriota bacterium]
MRETPRNLAASIHARLLNRARERQEDFQLVMQRYTAERLLYRLSRSTYRDQFVLKGAMLYTVWGGDAYRSTRDLDLLGHGAPDPAAMAKCFREICSIDVPDDALRFLSDTIEAEKIRDSAEYLGVRLRIEAHLERAMISLQVDIGFGNDVVPGPQDVDFPTMLGGPAPRIRAYPREAVVAEKLHAMVHLGEANSRLKDFYDLFVLSKVFTFDSATLSRAIAATFERRNTDLPGSLPPGLSPAFFANRGRADQWRAYLERNGLTRAPRDFSAVGEAIRGFLWPLIEALTGKQELGTAWIDDGSWTPAKREPTSTLSSGLKPYPSYKHSDVPWMGEIPNHWGVKRVRHLVSCLDGKRVPLNSQERSMMQGDYPYWGAGGVVDHIDRWIFDEELVLLGEDGAPFLEPHKTVAYCVTGKIWVNNHIHVLRPRQGIFGEFLASALNCVEYGVFIDGSTRDKLTQSDMADVSLPLPSYEQQQAIATFLTRQTTKIDALIAKKERLIELLQQKRTTLITDAVTKGLDPNVPMKDSGVEWLGRIPAHWDVLRIKNVASFITSGSRGWAEFYADQGSVFLQIGNLRSGSIDLDLSDIQRVVPPDGAEGQRTRVVAGDVLISITALIGAVGVVPQEMAIAYVNQHLALVRPRADLTHSRWLAYCLLSSVGQSQFATALYGGTKQGLGLDDIRNLRVLIMPLPEQQAMVNKIDCEVSKFDALISKVHEAIDRLKVYRTALISAGVTGKIDVREEVA